VTVEEALAQLRATLGKGLYPTAIPTIEEVLRRLEEDSFQAGYQQARETVGDWYGPKPLSY
jgi:hypothetical protein